MRILVCKNYDELSEQAARLVASQLILKPNSVLGLATGSTPVGMYQKLVKKYENKEIDFSEVTSFNLDEYYPINRESQQSYFYFMQKHLFSKVNIPPDRCYIPNGEAEDPLSECERYQHRIEQSGGIDLQILGIGQNGHIGFNEPDENLNCTTHLTKLTNDTLAANSRFFENKSTMPIYALTMGIAEILKAKKIILLASGSQKQAAVRELLNSEISTLVPATMLKVHPDVVLICDQDAYTNEE